MSHINNHIDSAYICSNSISVSVVSGACIYFLIDGDVVVYVGKSKSFQSRINQHVNDKSKDFSSFKIMKCTQGEMDVLEMFFINHYKPKYNTQLISKDGGFNDVILMISEAIKKDF